MLDFTAKFIFSYDDGNSIYLKSLLIFNYILYTKILHQPLPVFIKASIKGPNLLSISNSLAF